jgi:hypothetical protein
MNRRVAISIIVGAIAFAGAVVLAFAGYSAYYTILDGATAGPFFFLIGLPIAAPCALIAALIAFIRQRPSPTIHSMHSFPSEGGQKARKRGYFFVATSQQIAAMDITEGPLAAISNDIPTIAEPSILDIIVAAICGTQACLGLIGAGDDALLYRFPDDACSWFRRLLPEDPKRTLAEIDRVADQLMQNPAINSTSLKKGGVVALLLRVRGCALKTLEGDENQSLYYWFTPHSKHLRATLYRLANSPVD